MPFRMGAFVRHPLNPEWGIGKIVSIDDTGDISVHFPIGGKKTFRPSQASTPLEIVKNLAEALAEIHKRLLESKGLPYQGSRPKTSGRRRITGCYNCKADLDNAVNLECTKCGWILCLCGACGCTNPGKAHEV